MFSPAIDHEAYNLFDAPQLTGTPERRLLLAILERAILDFVGNDPEEVRTSEDWLFGDESENSTEESQLTPFGFGWVCQQLDLDRRQIAATIRRMPRRGTNRVAPWYFSKQGYFARQENEQKKASNLKKAKERKIHAVH